MIGLEVACGLVLCGIAVSTLVINGISPAALVYGAGTVCAFLALKRHHSDRVLKFLACTTAAVLLLSLGVIFIGDRSVLNLPSQNNIGIVLPLLATFATMFVLAHFSCRMKAGGCEAYFKSKKSAV